MIRNSGLKSDYSLIKQIGDNLYSVSWAFTPTVEIVRDEEGNPTGETLDTDYAVWTSETFFELPTIDLIRNAVLTWYNQEVDYKILNGHSWNEMSIWLSTENQFNYKAAYDLAVQTNGANLPIIFKFGTTNNPKYHTFESVEELSDFYMKAMNYINETLKSGWEAKDSVNFEEYQSELDKFNNN